MVGTLPSSLFELRRTSRFAHPTIPSLRKSRRLLLQRQRQSVREIRYGAVESAQQDDLEYLRLVAMRRQVSEFGVAERGAVVQRVDGRDQRLLGLRPASVRGGAAHGGADLFISQFRGGRKRRDMHTPFVLASRSRAGAVDDDLALPQGERPAIQEAAGAEFLP